MKNKLIILFISLHINCFSQDYKEALEFQNLLRAYHNYKPLKYDAILEKKAQEMADDVAKRDKMFFNIFDDYGQSIFSTENFSFGRDYYLEASVGWTIDHNNQTTLSQILCGDCRKIGFGLAISDTKVYVVALYDKLFY